MISGVPLLLTAAVVSYVYGVLPLAVQVFPVVLVQGIYYLLASSHMRLKMETLLEYCESMNLGEKPQLMNALYGYRGAIAVWLVLSLVATPLFIISRPGSSLTLKAIVEQSPWLTWMITLATFVWTTGISLFNIYKMSRLPLALKPFTEDTTLGLKPFASVGLRLTLLYVMGIAIIAIPTVLSRGSVQPEILAFYVGLTLLAFALFAFPMINLRKKLISAEREKLHWISQRYTTIMKKLEEDIEGNIDEKLQRELMVIDKLQRDIKQIRTWPFDTGIFLKLLAVTLSVVGIVLSRVISSILGL